MVYILYIINPCVFNKQNTLPPWAIITLTHMDYVKYSYIIYNPWIILSKINKQLW